MLTTTTGILDGSFESPALAAKSYLYAPNGSPWQFTAMAGVASNGSVFGNAAAPDGSQVAFLQQTGSVSETVYLDAGSYSISFQAAQRGSQTQTVAVLIDGKSVGTATPASSAFGVYETQVFTVAAGTHTVELLGLDPKGGDNTAFVDEVAINLSEDTIVDGNFESPTLAAKTYQYVPDGSPWQFTGLAGIAYNGSIFGSAAAPDGSQVALLQQTGSASESVYLDASSYSISFQAAQRGNQTQTIEVLIDGKAVGTATPASSAFGVYETQVFTVAAGTHTVELLGLNPKGGDNTAFVDEVAITSSEDTIVDGSFESPTLPAKTYQYAPNGSPWQFTGLAGIAYNGSIFGSAAAPDGSQVAVLQQTGSASESVYLDAGSYSISFQAAQRGSQTQTIEVLIDGKSVGTATPASSAFGVYETQVFTVAAGTHTVELLGLDPKGGDNSAFVDEVAINLSEDTIVDGNFESATLAAKTYQYAPNGSPWQFTGLAGIAYNGSIFGSAAAPDGSQVAVLQQTGGASETVYLGAGSYSISFQAAQRGSQTQTIEVLIDGKSVGTATPASSAFGVYETQVFTVAAGTHTVELLGLNPKGGDNTAFVDEVAITLSEDTIVDGNFESPTLAAATYQCAPNGSPWQFTGLAGIAYNGSVFNNATAPDGSQVAFLQQTGSASETVYLDAGSYSISFEAAQRGSQTQTIEVLIDGKAVGTATPVSSAFGTYQTSVFTVAAGTHTVELLGLNPNGGDNTAFVDKVTITPPNFISDGSFETPLLPAATYQSTPTGTAWTFSGETGISSNGSAITSGNPNAPDGNQVAFLQGSGNFSQSVSLNVGTYNLCFEAAQSSGQSNSEEIEVLVDGTTVGTITPNGTNYLPYQLSFSITTQGTHTIEFLGVDPSGGNDTALLDEVQATSANSLMDGSFEAPAVPANSCQYAPNGSPWQFTGLAGVASNGSAFGNAAAPNGSQVAFLQQTGSVSETVYLDAGSYSISYEAAQRGSQTQTIEVLIDGKPVGTATPVSSAFGTYETSVFTVAAGTHTVELLGLDPNGGDNTAFVDEVAINLSEDTIVDGSFESPTLAAATDLYTPNGSPWQFTAMAGVASNGSVFGNANAPDGSQVALLQQTGSASETVYLDAGSYSISFEAAQRGSQTQTIEVLIDGKSVGTATPANSAFGTYQTSVFTVAAGTHTVELLGLNPNGGDNTAFVDKVAITLSEDAMVDGSFELPTLAAATDQYAPNGSPWQFTGLAGVASNGSVFGNATAADGSQVAFLQQTGSASESVYLDAGSYSLSFEAAQRGSQTQTIEVLIDGKAIGTATPASSAFGTYQLPIFTVAAGIHSVELVGLNPNGGDNTAFVDEVAIAPLNLISDGSFETPVLAAATYQSTPTGTAWTFSGEAGITSNDSAITSGNPNAPDGNRVAFLQGTGNISQSVSLNAGSYDLSFQAAQSGGQSNSQEIEVLVDGSPIGTVTPSGTNYLPYQLSFSITTQGTHTIDFMGLDPSGGNDTALLDEVQVTSANLLIDGSFESPALPADSDQYAPNGSPWQFTGMAGIASNGSIFSSAAAPNGSQVAFLQQTGSASESVDLGAGSYSISFQAAQRGSQTQTIEVLIDGKAVGTATPASSAFGVYQTSVFTVAAGIHTVELLGLDPKGGDNTAFVDEVAITPIADTIVDGGFESPTLAAATYQSAPNGSPWQFAGLAGIAYNGSAFGNANAPDGSQVAFLQQTGSASESVYLDAGSYSISFEAAQRGSQTQTIEVLIDGKAVGTATPASSAFGTYQTSIFTVAAGTHTVELLGLNPNGGDNTAFVDKVQLSD